LDRAAAALADAAPDLLLLGGDFVSVRSHYVSRVTERLASIPAPVGRFAVLGNHDHWAGGREVTRALERAGIEVLTNRNRHLPPPFEQVTVCGLDDHIAGYPDATQAFAGATPVRLLLMHAPSGLLDVGEHPFTVAFAGHTHGGQIALRRGYPLYVPHGPLSRRYHGGRFQPKPDQVLLVSRGVGCSSVPFRWNVPAEVHLWSLSGSDSNLSEKS
jgi:predicted MPP superfamily phosphohydrolase